MSREQSKQIPVGMFIALLFVTMPAYAVTTYKTSDLGGGHQIWFEAEHFDERIPETDQYYTVVDEPGAFGQAINRAGGAGGIIRWTFDIRKADGTAGTWYFWGRVINPNNRSDFMIIEGNPNDPALPPGPPYNRPGDAEGYTNALRIFEHSVPPPWTWINPNHEEAHTKLLQDGENTMIIVPREGNATAFWDVFMWTDSASYVPTDADYENATPAPAATAASNPDPKNGAVVEATWVSLTWAPADRAVSHNVYLGDSFEDVNAGTGDTFRGNQTTTSFVAGFAGAPYPDGLVPGTTYYWRIDEVNDADPNSPWKGDVWSLRIPPKKAYQPTPADGAKYVAVDTTLDWVAGLGTKLHYVYFGDDFDTVNNATAGAPQVATSYTPAAPLDIGKTYYWRVDEFEGLATHKGDVWSFTTIPAIAIADPDLLGWWTLDESQGATAVDWSGHGNHGAFQGAPQWADGQDGGALSFDGRDDYVDTGNTQDLATWTIACWVISPAAPASASPSGPLHREKNYQFDWNHTDATFRGGAAMRIGGTWHAASYMPLDANTWYHLAATFDGTSLKAYRNGVLITDNPAASGTPDAETGTLKLGRHATAAQYFTGTVDDARVYNKALTADQIKQLVRGDPLRAWNPNPDNRSVVDIDRARQPLTWSRGDNAAQHDVYFGLDKDAVANADASDTTGVYRGRQSAASYTPTEGLAWGGGPYYWRIDEVNNDGTISAGQMWSFSVADYLVVDDIESYNDLPETDPASNRIYLSWIDGFGTTTNGALVGNLDVPLTERSNTHGGSQAMPLSYDNNLKFSEATLTLTGAARDWTREGVGALSLWFRGLAANAAERMYVALSGTAVVVHGDPAAVQVAAWTEWVIPLQQFADLGVNLANVTSITIGFGARGNTTTPGGTGQMYFDDIRLVRPAAP